MPAMMRTVLSGSPELQVATLSILSRCDSEIVGAVGDIAIGIGSTTELCDLVITAINGGVVPDLVTFLATLPERALATVGALPVFTEAAVPAALSRHWPRTPHRRRGRACSPSSRGLISDTARCWR